MKVEGGGDVEKLTLMDTVDLDSTSGEEKCQCQWL